MNLVKTFENFKKIKLDGFKYHGYQTEQRMVIIFMFLLGLHQKEKLIIGMDDSPAKNSVNISQKLPLIG